MPHTIVVGTDASPNAANALRWAITIAPRLNAEIVAVHALGLLEATERDAVQRRFESRWCHLLDGTGVPNRRLLRDGPPALALMTAAREVGADLIVLGRRGESGTTSLLLGSTSAQVAHESPVPVTVVPG